MAKASNVKIIISVIIIGAALAVILASGVGREGSPTEESAAPGKAGKFGTGGQNESCFLNEIDKNSYPKAKAPEKPPLLRWDFSGNKVYAYDYRQELKNKYDMGGPAPVKDAEQVIEGKGKLLLKSRGNRTANLVLKDMQVEMKITKMGFETKDKTPGSMKLKKFPPIVVQGVKEDSAMKVANSSQEMLIKLLFPLPPKPLKVGESADVPAFLPFNAMGSLLHVTGESTITLTSYVTINGRTCARLETKTDISKLDVPEEMKGTYGCLATSRSVFYFDIEERAFVRGGLAFLMKMRVDAPMPEMEVPDMPALQDAPKRMKMQMEMDTIISLERAP